MDEPPPPPTTLPQSPPPLTPAPGDVGSIIPRTLFDEMLKHRDEFDCEGQGLYTYGAFIDAANAFPEFGTTGDLDTRKRELAAFFAQTSHETTG